MSQDRPSCEICTVREQASETTGVPAPAWSIMMPCHSPCIGSKVAKRREFESVEDEAGRCRKNTRLAPPNNRATKAAAAKTFILFQVMVFIVPFTNAAAGPLGVWARAADETEAVKLAGAA